MRSIRTCAIITAGLALWLGDSGWAQASPAEELPTIAARWVPLRAVYHLRVESNWPAPVGETDACNNRASETLVGTLTRVAPDRYEGRLARRTRLGFCGTHGVAIERCRTVLRGSGEVVARGRVVSGPVGRMLALVWQPVPETTRIAQDGSCMPRFTAALEAMYRTALHSVEFPLPATSPQRFVLEDYGRVLEIR
jgi:hypothetical protein